MHRQPEDLPNEHVLMYPPELAGPFEPITDLKFQRATPSIETPSKTVVEEPEAP